MINNSLILKLGRKNRVFLGAIGSGVLLWGIEALIHTFVFDSNRSFTQHFLAPDIHELWMRLMILITFLFFGAFTQIVINRAAQAEERFKLVIHQSPSVIEIYDLDGLQLEVNSAYEKLWGFPAITTVNKFNILKSKEIEDSGLLDYVNKAYAGEVAHVPPYVFDPRGPTEAKGKGRVRWLSTRIYPLKDNSGYINNIVIAHEDITEQRLAEEALLESEEKFKIIIKNSQPIIFMMDNDGIFSLSEGHGLAALGLEPGQVVGASAFEMYKDFPIIIKGIKRALRGAFFRDEIDVGGIHFDIFFSPFRDINKNVIGLMGMAINITERKISEQELILLNKELEQRILERTQEIESFSYSVSHDLRAPLRAIIGFSKILIEDFAKEIDYKIHDYLNKIHQAGQDMNELINDMLSLSKLSQENPSLTHFSPDEIALQIFENLIAAESKREINFQAGACPEINADRNLIKILLTNLISNAIKFTRGEPSASIEFGSLQEKDRVVFFLRDNGIGFNMSYADKIFTPFQRLHKRDNFDGTGIGLAIVYRVIQIHNGKVWAESEEGEGTTIFFTIGRLQINGE